MKASGTIGATGILAALLCLTLTAVVEAHDTTVAVTVLVTLTRGKPSDSSLGAGNVPDFASHQRDVETIIGT